MTRAIDGLEEETGRWTWWRVLGFILTGFALWMFFSWLFVVVETFVPPAGETERATLFFFWEREFATIGLVETLVSLGLGVWVSWLLCRPESALD